MWEKEKLDELAMHLLVGYTLIRYAAPTDVKSLLKCSLPDSCFLHHAISNANSTDV